MPVKRKNREVGSQPLEFEYSGTVQQDLLDMAKSGEVMNQTFDHDADHFLEFERKDLQATINYLQMQGWYGDAAHLQKRLDIIG